MIEALWAVAFVAGGVNRGAGVIIFESGRIFGGDSQYYYTSEYWLEDKNRVRGELTVTHYAGEPNSIFGPRLLSGSGVLDAAWMAGLKGFWCDGGGGGAADRPHGEPQPSWPHRTWSTSRR